MYRDFFNGPGGAEGFNTGGMTQQNMLADGGEAAMFGAKSSQP